MSEDGWGLRDSQRMPLEAIGRNLDFKIPVWALIGIIASFIFGGLRMYFQVEALVKSVTELNETMRSVSDKLNSATVAQAHTAGQIERIHERLQRLEQDHARMYAAHEASGGKTLYPRGGDK